MSATQMHHNHFDHAANIALAVFFGATSWWVGWMEDYGQFMTHFLVPTLSATVLSCQLWLMWKKHRRK